MSSELDDLEALVMSDARQIYSETAIEHAMNPRNVGNILDDDGYASVTGPCGDTMQIWLKVKGDQIQNATFWTDGCGATIATGSMVTELAIGKSVVDVQRIAQQDVLDALGGLPEENVHCAELAANTLREAIKNYLAIKKEPWKKAYRKH